MQALPVADGTISPDVAPPQRAAPDAEAAVDGRPPFDTPLARMALSRARIRAVIPMDAVTFVAPCPGCGRECEWTQERQETRVRSRMDCPCSF